MNDQTVKEALSAIATHSTNTLKAHLALSRLVAKRMENLSPDERAALLTAIESDQKKTELLSEVLRILS